MNPQSRNYTSIRCPLCGHPTKVIESYLKGQAYRRRRECRHCRYRITTAETIHAPERFRPAT